MKHLSMIRALAALSISLTSAPLAAQAPPPAAAADTTWNRPRALELIQRAQQRRAAANADTGLANYQADARLYVYFYLDRTDTGERNLVKTDQLALDVLWAAPDRVKQRILGWRDQKSLPTNINYHLDHLTVVQENFGDEIQIGDGDEVREVVHPAAPNALEVYDYRLADSLTLRLPGATEPVRVYELRVRPKDPSRPAFLGSVFVERRAGDLVRMDFTFTRAAYRDRYLDYINISLDNGLWEGRFWLPNEQRVEIRRQVPQLDFPVGSVIRGSMRVGNYRFNQKLPPGLFAGPKVVAAPRSQREAFPFEEGIHAEVREEGIGPAAELGRIREMAGELVRRQALQRVTGARLNVSRSSEVLRFNRAEGLAVGAGVSVTPTPGARVVGRAGWALGAEHPFGSLALQGAAGGAELALSGYANRLGDVGLGAAASGALSTLSGLFAGEDYLDPFYASGAALEARFRMAPTWSLSARARVETQRSARRETDFSLFGGDVRPVRDIDRAEPLLGLDVEARRQAPAESGRWWDVTMAVRSGTMNPGKGAPDCVGAPGCEPLFQRSFLKPRASLAVGRRWTPAEAELRLTAHGGLAVGELPRQELYLLGGRATLPGYHFRRFGGDRFGTVGATLAADLWRPWLRGRVLAAAGWVGVGEPGREALTRWGATVADGGRASLGIGVGIFHDILRVDLARGLASDGRWELIVEANPSFWDFL